MTRQRDGMTILSLEGSADAVLFSRLRTHVVPACPPQPIVLDITALTIAGSGAFHQLTAFLHWSSQAIGQVCLVCRRLSGRRLLHRSGAAEIVPVFMTVDEAVEALLVQGTPAATPAGGAPRAGGPAGPSRRRTGAGRPVQ